MGKSSSIYSVTFKKAFKYDKNQRAFNVNGTVALSSRVSLAASLSPCCRWPAGILHPGLEGSHAPWPHCSYWLTIVGAGWGRSWCVLSLLLSRSRPTHSFLDGPCVDLALGHPLLYQTSSQPFSHPGPRGVEAGGMWFYLLLFVFNLNSWCTILCKLQLYNIVIYKF